MLMFASCANSSQADPKLSTSSIVSPNADKGDVVNLLVIFSFKKQSRWHSDFISAITQTFADKGVPLNLFIENADSGHFNSPNYTKTYLDMLEAKYAELSLDYIISENLFTSRFLIQYDNFFADVPRYFAQMTNDMSKENVFTPIENGFIAHQYVDFTGSVEYAITQAQAQQVYFILDSIQVPGFDRKAFITEALQRIRLPVSIWWDKTSRELSELLPQISPQSAVIYAGSLTNGADNFIQPFEFTQFIHQYSPAPISSPFTYLVSEYASEGYGFDMYNFSESLAQDMLFRLGYMDEYPILAPHNLRFINESKRSPLSIFDSHEHGNTRVFAPQHPIWEEHQLFFFLVLVFLSAGLAGAILQMLYHSRFKQKNIEIINAQLAKEESSALLKMTIAESQIGTWEYDVSTKMIQMDAQNAAIYGHDGPYTCAAREWIATIHPDDLTQFQKDYDTLLTTQLPHALRCRVHTSTQELKYVSGFAHPVLNHHGEVVKLLGITQDVTAVKNHELSLLELSRQAQASNQAKSQFLANMSHEIRTPMNGIIGVSELLQHTQLTQRQQHYATLIDQSANALLNILNDILDLTLVEKGHIKIKKHSFDVIELTQNVIDNVKPKLQQKSLALKQTYESASLIMVSDASRLRQILLNLLGNAVKYTESGHISIDVSTRADTLMISIKDTGIGIEQVKLDTIFKPFERVHNVTQLGIEGIGLGLSIAYQLTDLLGGHIQVVSRLGLGSTFTLQLPLLTVPKTESVTDNAVASVVQEEYAIAPLNNSVLNVLVAEDNEINQIVINEQLIHAGHQITIVNNGKEALELYQSRFFDIVIMDVMMPVMDGLEATRKIRQYEVKKKQYTPIIGLTANALKGNKQECIDAGMDAYLSKPTNSTELLNQIAAMRLN